MSPKAKTILWCIAQPPLYTAALAATLYGVVWLAKTSIELSLLLLFLGGWAVLSAFFYAFESP